jgi:nitroreductase
MEFGEVLKRRRSIRKFEGREVPDERISEILELAKLSPSAGNLQARKVIVVKNKEIKEKLARAALDQDFIAEASVVFVIIACPEESAGRYGERGKNLYALQDATIFASYLQLVATNLGLASYWVGAFREEEVKNILELEETLVPIAIIPVGYAAEEPRKTPRKDLDEFVKYLE